MKGYMRHEKRDWRLDIFIVCGRVGYIDIQDVIFLLEKLIMVRGT